MFQFSIINHFNYPKLLRIIIPMAQLTLKNLRKQFTPQVFLLRILI